MTKTDEALFDLNKTYAAYIESFFPFEYNNKTFRLVDIYVADPWRKCNSCGNQWTEDVSVIRSTDGKELHIGTDCLDVMTNRKTAEWFKKFKTKRMNVTSNRKYIDDLASMLAAYERRKLAFQMPENDAEQLQATLRQMCNGLNPTRKQLELAERYLKMGAFI